MVQGGFVRDTEFMFENERAKILLVDDEKELTFVLRAHLAAAGHQVHEAHDGKSALAAAEALHPDLIVLDVGLPDTDGISVTRRLKSNPATQDIAIIMLTARSDPNHVVMALEAGAQEYVVKPFDVSELMARIRTVHRLRQVRRQLDDLNAGLAAEVEQRTRRLRMLYNFSRALNEADSKSEILDLVVDTAKRVTDSRRVSVLLQDADGRHLVCARAVGIDADVASRIRIPITDGVAGKVFTTGKTFVASALPPDAVSENRYESDAFLSTPLIATTLMTRESKLGVLSITDRVDGRPFTPDETECIRSIADSAAIALHNQIHRERLDDSVNVLLMTVGRLAEFRDNETSLHLERVREYARVLATRLQSTARFQPMVDDEFVENLYRAAPMHDVGKVGVPDHVLCKPDKLTPDEYRAMQRHCQIGRDVLQSAMTRTGPVPLLKMCVEIASSHHERYDGNGYPDGLQGDAIPLSARIIALVDAYDAITSKRRYKPATSHERALEIVRSERGKHFDPDLVEAFLGCADEFDAIRRQHSDEAQARELATVDSA